MLTMRNTRCAPNLRKALSFDNRNRKLRIRKFTQRLFVGINWQIHPVMIYQAGSQSVYHRVFANFQAWCVYDIDSSFSHLPSLSLIPGNTLSLTNAYTSLADFLAACKRLCHLCVLAGTSDSKTPKLYYFVVVISVIDYCCDLCAEEFWKWLCQFTFFYSYI